MKPFAFAFALIAGSAAAANIGELWEVSTVMNVPGMPAGMGSQKSQVCRDKDAPAGPPRSDCKISNHKRSGLTESMTVSCPRQDAMQVEMTYNAARTEYKGTMKSGDMVINTSGRKVGACDPQVAKAQTDAKVAAAKKQGAEASAQLAKVNDGRIKGCAEAVETMNVSKLDVIPMCAQNPATCKLSPQDKDGLRVQTACRASADEYCKRYQTMDGFLKARGDEQGARLCKTTPQQVRASLCPRAAQTENLAFVGRQCPAEAKPIAKAHCVGRDYTSKRDKYTDFCVAYLSQHGGEEDSGGPAGRPAAEKKAATTGDKVNDAAQQGINKLKGLFGR